MKEDCCCDEENRIYCEKHYNELYQESAEE